MGMAAGVAGAVSLMGKGIAVTKGVAKVHGAAGAAVAGGAMAGASAVRGGIAARSMAQAGTTPVGVYRHLTPTTAASLGGTELAAHSVLQNDPFSQQMVKSATAHLPSDASMQDRIDVLSSNSEFRPMMQQWLDGPHMAHVARGEIDPTKITTTFSSTQQRSMMNMAAEASQAHFRNQGGVRSVAKVVKPAAAREAA